tara:strand:- start:65 stop:715 length:651 start_codon:yes stop_codon:yes gene_type:complete
VNIILFGPPGAGKGTQAVNLVKEFQLHKISIGDILRNEIENNTSLGIKIKSTIDKGSFVSDDIINDLVQKIITNKKINNNLIFDGYPRNLNQAKELDLMVKQNSQVISCVLSLNVDKEVVVKRILGRRICSNCGMIFNIYFSPSTKQNHKCEEKYLQKRTDDTEKVIKKRFDTYKNETLPILNFYKEQNLLHQINGMAKIDDISKEIRGIIASIET